MQLNTETTFLKKHLFFIPDLLILIIFLILGFYKHVIYDRSFIAYYSIIFLFVIFSILSVYMKLYCWRKLPLSVSSFILFSINCLQLLLYIMVIKVLLDPDTTGLNEPIYLSNISITSQYRYLILTAISLFVIVGLIIAQIFSYDILSPVFPSLREEIYKILYTWNDGCIVDTCNKLTDLLYSSFWFRISFTITHFSIFHLTRLFGAYLLVQCAFFQGDFRIFVYLVPIMLVRWLLSFFDYYFFTFLKASENYIRSLVTVTLANKGPAVFGFIKIDSTSQVSFTLTDNALLKGYTDSHISNLAQEWYIEVELASYFNVYFRFVKYLYYFILLLRVSCWYYITYIFFFSPISEGVFSSPFFIWYRSLGKIAVRPYATQAHRPLVQFHKDLSKETTGVQHGNHPALIDPAVKNPNDPTQILYEGQLTHGKGSPQNPSYPLHSSKDLQGDTKPQNIVPPVGTTYVKEYYFDPNPLPGSQSFLNDPEVKVNLAKYTPQEENT